MKPSGLPYRFFVSLILISQFTGLASYIRPRSLQSQPVQESIEGTAPSNQPVSISRVQSSYTAGQTTISFEITNNLPVTRWPSIPVSSTVTNTLSILSGFVLTDDANTLSGIQLSDSLINGTSFVSASGEPVVSADTVTWSLPDLPPMGTSVVTMTVQTPAQSGDFIDLDLGANVQASVWGEPVTSTARPALVVPDGIDPAFTQASDDADIYDRDMLWRSTFHNQDALTMFAFVRSMGYDAYWGSLRGTRGTLWGERGNSADQSSLLIAMLRAAGVPARYRHGTLASTQSQVLIAAMFPPIPGRGGTLPADVQVSDPINDPDLIARVSDHWWVEAYLPGQGWTDLDPSFSGAQPGEIFAVPGTYDRVSEIPNTERHKITVRLVVEQYSSFPLSGSNTVLQYPLEVEFNTSILASKRLTLGHLVASNLEAGVFSSVTHYFTPYFSVEENDIYYEGDVFQDYLSNFPLSSTYSTAEWIEYEITAPDGSLQTFTRTVKDLIGADVRTLGGNPVLQIGLESPPFAGMDDIYVNWVIPNDVQPWVMERWTGAILPRVDEIAQHGQQMQDISEELEPGEELTPDQQADLNAANTNVIFANEFMLASVGLDFARQADDARHRIEQGMLTRMYYDSPRVFTIASVGILSDTVATTIDLRRTTSAVIVYPGQAAEAALSAQWAKGIVESLLEGKALETAIEGDSVTTVRVFEEMALQGVSPVLLTPSDAAQMDLYPISDEARAHMLEALLEGLSILAPSQPVSLGEAKAYAWWQFDPETGETISVGENGLRSSFDELAMLVEMMIETYAAGGGIQADTGDVIESATIIGQKLVGYFESVAAGFENATSAAPLVADSWRYLPAYLCPISNCGVEQFFQDNVTSGPIPLPDMLFAYASAPSGSNFALNAVNRSGQGGGEPSLSLAAAPQASTIDPGQAAFFAAEITSTFDDRFTISAYAPDGWTVNVDASGMVSAQPSPGAAPGDYPVDIVVQSHTYPGLFDRATHVVTVSALNTVSVVLNSEPNLTVPMGSARFEAVSNQTNDGETEVPGAAFRIEISNPGQSANTFTLAVSGPPQDWLWLNGEHDPSTNLTLAPGQSTSVGLYLQAPGGSVPAPGTAYPVNVTLTGQGIAGSDSAQFTMPGQPFNFVQLEPQTVYLGSNSSTALTLSMTGVGNTNGSFPLTAITPPISATVDGLPSEMNPVMGATQSAGLHLTTAGVPVGARFPVVIGGAAPDSYTQYSIVQAQIVSDISEAVFLAAGAANKSCTLGEPGLSDSLEALALSMVNLEASCQYGDCNLLLRDQVVSAAYSTALYAGSVSADLAGSSALVEAADALAVQDQEADILTSLADISGAVTVLESEVCAWSQHKPELQWSPYLDAALIGENVPFTLTLSNAGSITTTYALTITSLSGVDVYTPTVHPSGESTYVLQIAGAEMGVENLSAVAVVADMPEISAQASAALNVVDKFVQLLAVHPAPDFVDTGTSQTTLSIDVANIAGISQALTARTNILAASGAISYTADTPVALLIGPPRTYQLQNVDTSGWAEGVYTVSVSLLDSTLTPVPEGSGNALLGVGQVVGARHAVIPEIVAPGTFTITTVITSELLVQDVLSITTGTQAFYSPTGQTPVSVQGETVNTGSAEHPLLIQSSTAITRTEDTDASMVYTGTWNIVDSINSERASAGIYTWSNTPGNQVTYDFNGTWAQIGLITQQDGGHVEIIVDEQLHGVVDLYTSDPETAVYTISALAEGPHSIRLHVPGTRHPFSLGFRVMFDYVDTWDGTLYPDGLTEQDNSRVLRSKTWIEESHAAASGGSYMRDGLANDGTAWFPFTGDSVSFIAFANAEAHRVGVWVDGLWQGNVKIYSASPITRTFSFGGFGEGPHVLAIRYYQGEPNIDAFVTPATGPFYAPPVRTGIVRYEEDHPALSYDGEDFLQRHASWDFLAFPQVSDNTLIQSATISDTVSLAFEGSWVNIGVRTRNRGGYAEMKIDGASYGLIHSYSEQDSVASYAYDLPPGPHILELIVLGQSPPPGNIYNQFYLDYIEIYDGSPVTDDFQNAQKHVEADRIYISQSAGDKLEPNAVQGDYVSSGLANSNSNVWYSFVGDGFTFTGLTEKNGGSAQVFVDNLLVDTVSFNYPFSVTPIEFHYTGFGEGVHAVRIHNINAMRVDGFASNPSDMNPYQPQAEWWDNTPAGNGAPFGGTFGVVTGMAVGDINNDGLPEIVVPADNLGDYGALFVFRGDGQDAGSGNPIIWQHDFGGGVYKTLVGSAAIADLDGNPGAEIVIAAGDQIFAFHGDGSTYWITDTVSILEGLSSPAIGNLDLDPEPEIVINTGNQLEVRNADGSLAWSLVFPAAVNPPVLVDLTGDGLLDILVTGWSNEIYLYDFNLGNPQLVWSAVLPASIAGTFGAPAVADIDGLQPGGDPGPEIAVASAGVLSVLNGEDGSEVWSTPLDPGNPGGVSIGDLDGDGEVEIVTGMRYEFETGRFGRLYALNADGSILWSAIAEDSSSANNTSLADVDGDGKKEVLWNGKQQGFTIFRGDDGAILFNEPLSNSQTGSDYPLYADVDGDGQGEVVVPAIGGIRVLGNGAAWVEAREIWNQHSYHVTNINDDLSIPFNELDSWSLHNTYRNQTRNTNPMPVYRLSVSHTMGLQNQAVLTDTFAPAPDTESHPVFGWNTTVSWEQTVVTQTFTSVLTDLLPGENRLVAQGTTVTYDVIGGANRIDLPPLFVRVPHIAAVTPQYLETGAGGTAVFTATLTNPFEETGVYTLTLSGLPDGWVTFPMTATVSGGQTIHIPLIVDIPQAAGQALYPFLLDVDTDLGFSDQAGGQLTVLGKLLEMAISPTVQEAAVGELITYTLTLTNTDTASRTYDLVAAGQAEVTLPSQVTVLAGASKSLDVPAAAVTAGPNPFTIVAQDTLGRSSGSATAEVVGFIPGLVSLDLEPESAQAGPGVPAAFSVTVTNLGALPDTFALSAVIPDGWVAVFSNLGTRIDSVSVSPGAGNAAVLGLTVTPPPDAAAGDITFEILAQSAWSEATAVGSVQVSGYGVGAEFVSGPFNVLPNGSGSWQVEVRNNGEQPDTYQLSLFGSLAELAQINLTNVSVNPGEVQIVNVDATGFDGLLGTNYLLGVHAQSQSQQAISTETTRDISVVTQPGLSVAWEPVTRTIEGVNLAVFRLKVTNSGNLADDFTLTFHGNPQVDFLNPPGAIRIPGKTTVILSVKIVAPEDGQFLLSAIVTGSAGQDSAEATLVVTGFKKTMYLQYLPMVIDP